MKATSAALLTVSLGLLAGCSTTGTTSADMRNFSLLRLPGVSRAEAFQATRAALSERFILDDVDAAEGKITTAATEMDGTTETGQVGDLLGTERRVRKLAEAQVNSTAGGAEVWCKVSVQRYETDERIMFRRETSREDIPSQTPAEYGGATTAEQNSVWRTVRRDKLTERSVLRSIQEFVGRYAPDGATPAPQTTVPAATE